MISASGWLRQARHRAKKYGVLSILTIEQLRTIIVYYDTKCAYCHRLAATLDNPVPFAEGGINSQANVFPICIACKSRKRTHDIAWYYNIGAISEEAYIRLVGELLQRDYDGTMKPILRKMAGVV